MNNMIDSTSDYNSLQTNNVYMNEMIYSTADYNSFAYCRPIAEMCMPDSIYYNT